MIKNLKEEVWIYGGGSIGRDAYQAISAYSKSSKVIGIFDKNRTTFPENDSIPIYKPSMISQLVNNGSQVVIAVTHKYIDEVNSYLLDIGLSSEQIYIFNFHDFDIYGKKSINRLMNHLDSIKILRKANLFKNEAQANKILDAVLASDINMLPEPQNYRDIFSKLLSECILSRKMPVLFNAGSVDGIDYELLLKGGGDGWIESEGNSKATILSCDIRNADLITITNLDECLNEILIGAGLSGDVDQFKFFLEDGTRSRFESPRTKDFSAEEKLRLCKVQALTLKSMLRLANIDRIDFYKSDIEGLDYEVLNCSSEVFKKYKPFLFVSVYHLINDLFEIPKLINTFGMYELSLHNFERDGREMFVVGVPKVTN